MGTFLLPVGKRQLNTINANENLTRHVSVPVFRDLLNKTLAEMCKKCNKTLIDRRQEPDLLNELAKTANWYLSRSSIIGGEYSRECALLAF